MKKMRLAAAATLVALLAGLAPHAPADANGAASTRNILLGGAAAAAGALILINHNRQVHERYAQDAAKQAALAQQRNNAWAAYNSEKSAYQHEALVAGELKKEIAYQHEIIVQQKKQLAMAKARPGASFERRSVAQVKTASGKTQQVAVVSYGWGSL